ncbi:MAG: membrane protein insertion efficiency factor YidD [Synergistaceae bacterium]|nr:membrane protein insertion efficiency factor YidD [Candidatus Equadaptatus faecalis]
MKLKEVPAETAVFFVRMYRAAVSPLLGGGKCRFCPTCSEYAVEAFREYGFCLGFLLAARRLLRCGPWSSGGYDPLPDREEIKRIWLGRLFKPRKDG